MQVKDENIIICKSFEKTKKYLLVPTDNNLYEEKYPKQQRKTSRRSFQIEREAGKKTL